MIDTGRFMLLSLIFMRMAGFILLNPILGRKNIPGIIKSGFIVLFTLLIYTFSGDSFTADIKSPIEYAILLLKEFGMGYIIGFTMQLFFFIISFAGDIIDFNFGLSMAKIFDVQSNSSLSLSATLYNTMFVLMFFAVDGHLALIQMLLTTGEIVPYGNIIYDPAIGTKMLEIFSTCVILGVKMSFPFLAIEFLIEMGVGILMKTIPQINIFVVNIQAKLLVGLLLLLIFLSPMGSFMTMILTKMLDTIKEMIYFIH